MKYSIGELVAFCLADTPLHEYEKGHILEAYAEDHFNRYKILHREGQFIVPEDNILGIIETKETIVAR
jgi:hypothetical protein